MSLITNKARFVAITCALAFLPGSGWGAELLRFKPSDDATVNKSYSSKNYGGGSSLRVDATPDTRILMKFKVSGINGRQVNKATLKLYVINSCSQGGNVYGLESTSWSEGTVTYSTKPLFSSTMQSSIGSVSSGVWKSADVSALVKADGVFGIGLKPEVSDGCEYASKENSSGAYAPVLELEVASIVAVSPSPSPAPSATPQPSPSPSPVASPTPFSTADMGYRAIFDETQYIDGVACKPQGAYKDWSIRRSSGGRAFRFEVHQGENREGTGDTANGKDRAEIMHGLRFPTGKEIWESHSFMVEPGAAMTSTWNVMGQWHAGAGTPILFYTLSTNESFLISSRHGSSTDQQRLDLYRFSFKRGVWYNVVQHVKFGSNSNAVIQVWINGQLVIDKKDISVGYSDSSETYWKFGLYRNTTSVVTSVHFANVEVGYLSLFDRVAHPLEIKP